MPNDMTAYVNKTWQRVFWAASIAVGVVGGAYGLGQSTGERAASGQAIQEDVDELQGKVTTLRSDVADLEGRVKILRFRLQEMTEASEGPHQ